MRAVLDAIEAFFEGLASVEWRFLGLAVVFHLLKLFAVARSWRNILAAAYPNARVRGRTIFGAYAAGVGVNAVLPVRSGDAMKLYLAKRGIDGATYATLTSTLFVQTLFDFAVATALLAWAASLGVLPGLDLLPDLPSLDFSWAFDHPRLALLLAGILVAVGGIAALWLVDHARSFRQRFAQGLAVLREPRVYLRRVLPWQVADWTFRLVTIYCFLRAFALDTTLENALLVQVTQSLATVLPFSPGGIGTEQALVVYVFRGDVPASALLSFSVGMKLTIIAANVVVGFGAIAIMLRRLPWRRIRMEDDVAEAEPEPRPS